MADKPGTSQNAPMPPAPRKAQMPLEQLSNEATRIRDRIYQESNINACQQSLVALDAILKDLAQAQQLIGALRRESGQHVASLRQANPKGLPGENEVRTFSDGVKRVYTNKKWLPAE